MIISYYGDGSFRLQSGEVVITVDPTNNRQKADLVLRTITDTDVSRPGADEIVFPGEYELKGIEIQGWSVAQESTKKAVKTVFMVLWEDMRFVFMGHISKLPDTQVLKDLAEADVLFLPTGMEGYLPTETAVKLIHQLEPAVVIPSYFKKPDELSRAMGQKTQPQEKFVFKKKDLGDKKAEVVVLESKT